MVTAVHGGHVPRDRRPIEKYRTVASVMTESLAEALNDQREHPMLVREGVFKQVRELFIPGTAAFTVMMRYKRRQSYAERKEQLLDFGQTLKFLEAPVPLLTDLTDQQKTRMEALRKFFFWMEREIEAEYTRRIERPI
jgi:hypothetical protein